MSATIYAARPGLHSSPEWRRGDQAQRAWESRLLSRGCAVLPCYRMRDEDTGLSAAPALATSEGDLVLPDLLVLGPGRPRWEEVKGKHGPAWCRTRSEWVHGADARRLDQYRRVQAVSGIPVLLIVREDTSPIDPDHESPLVPAGTWLAIALDEVYRTGTYCASWPGGLARPALRGTGRAGGILWPRSLMAQADGEEGRT